MSEVARRRASASAATLAAVVVALAFVSGGCGGDEVSAPARAGSPETSATEPRTDLQTEAVPPQPGLPPPVSSIRARILTAAGMGDYEQLRPLVDADVFLSDFGFGAREPDSVGRWEHLGPELLETMSVLLRMEYIVRETNEGTLYQWPRFGPDSKSDDELPRRERELLRTIMTDDELSHLFLPELGYTGPRLGILADGTWWFFILEGEG